MPRTGPFLAILGVLLVGLLAAGAARAQAQSTCDAPLFPYPADVVQDSWVRIEVQNQGPPAQVTLCIIEQDARTNGARHRALLPAASEYNHTFRVIPGTFEVQLRVFDPSGATTS